MIVNTANKCRCCVKLKRVARIELVSDVTQGLVFESEQMIVTDVDAWYGPVLEAKVFFDDGSTANFNSISNAALYDDGTQAFLELTGGSLTITGNDVDEADRGTWTFSGIYFEGVKSEEDPVPAWFFYNEGYFYPPVLGNGLWTRP